MAFISMVIVCMVFGMVISIPGYILTGVALFTIAKRRGIAHRWTAWIPMAQLWLMGGISDHYQRLAKQKCSRKQQLILWLISTLLILHTLLIVLCLFASDQTTLISLVFIPAWCVTAALVIIGFLAMYDLYVSCDPDHAVLYFTLSILLSAVQPIFLFVSRKKDLGLLNCSCHQGKKEETN